MDPTKAPSQIFDRELIKVRRARAARRGDSFLAIRAAKDAAERLCDVNRQFENALLIGSPEFSAALLESLPDDKVPLKYVRCFESHLIDGLDLNAPDDDLRLSPECFDVIISGLSLHTVNDLPGALIAMRQFLKPDGLFIGAMFGGATLSELRGAAYAADETVFGGLTPRVLPFADYSQAAALLQRGGFALPVVDMDRLTIRYKSLETLISDLRDMGDMNGLMGRDKRTLGAAWRDAFTQNYQTAHSENGKFVATFEILWMTGWAPHESQQKPLKPGSAKTRLADALGTIEKLAE